MDEPSTERTKKNWFQNEPKTACNPRKEGIFFSFRHFSFNFKRNISPVMRENSDTWIMKSTEVFLRKPVQCITCHTTWFWTYLGTYSLMFDHYRLDQLSAWIVTAFFKISYMYKPWKKHCQSLLIINFKFMLRRNVAHDD